MPDHAPAPADVVVVVRGGSMVPAGVDRAVAGGARVELRTTAAALHLDLCAVGRADLLVDAAGGDGLRARFGMLAQHVRRGGQLVVLLPPADGPHAGPRRRLLALGEDILRLRASGDLQPPRPGPTDHRPQEEQDEHARAASVERWAVTTWAGQEAVVVDVGGPPVLATVPEHGWDALLAARPGLGETVLVHRAAPSPRLGTFASSDASEAAFEGDAPPLSLRVFPEAWCAPGQVATSDDVVLPSSFRDPVRPRLRIRSLVGWTARAVLDPRPTEHAGDAGVRLPGPHLHLDNVLRGHFGHAMTEQLSLAWAWQEVRRRRPDARALVLAPDGDVAPWERELLEAAGIARDDVEVARAPVRVEELWTATPAYAIDRYVHPRLVGVWDTVGERLEAAAGSGPRPERVFLARPPGRRSCTDADAVEGLFAEFGFVAVRPETLSLADQVALVRGASAVAGYAGSGTFHLALASTPVPVLAVASDTYAAANERQMCAARGHDLSLVRGSSTVGAGVRWEDRMHSDYTLGPSGLAWLRDRLERLGPRRARGST